MIPSSSSKDIPPSSSKNPLVSIPSSSSKDPPLIQTTATNIPSSSSKDPPLSISITASSSNITTTVPTPALNSTNAFGNEPARNFKVIIPKKKKKPKKPYVKTSPPLFRRKVDVLLVKYVLSALRTKDGVHLSAFPVLFRTIHGRELDYKTLGYERLSYLLNDIDEIQIREEEGIDRVFVVDREALKSLSLEKKAKLYQEKVDEDVFISKYAIFSHDSSDVVARDWWDMQCKICGSLYRAPVSLRCGHIFCRICVRALDRSRDNIECPICLESHAPLVVPLGDTDKDVPESEQLWLLRLSMPIQCKKCGLKYPSARAFHHQEVCQGKNKAENFRNDVLKVDFSLPTPAGLDIRRYKNNYSIKTRALRDSDKHQCEFDGKKFGVLFAKEMDNGVDRIMKELFPDGSDYESGASMTDIEEGDSDKEDQRGEPFPFLSSDECSDYSSHDAYVERCQEVVGEKITSPGIAVPEKEIRVGNSRSQAKSQEGRIKVSVADSSDSTSECQEIKNVVKKITMLGFQTTSEDAPPERKSSKTVYSESSEASSHYARESWTEGRSM